MKKFAPKTYGFSLVELAVVLVIVGIVVTMGLKATLATLETTAYSVTKAKQDQLKTALIGFLRTNGRLPCPDTSAGAPVGTEASPCNANAQAAYGVIPWQTLGIPRDSALDGWGNFYTYRVANGSPVSVKNWTAKLAPGTDFTVNELKTQTDAITVQELDNAQTALQVTTTKAVAIILSHGKNGLGAKTTKVGDRMPTDDAGAGELTNATSTTTGFVLRPVNDAGGFNGTYDDLLVYLTPQDLLQPLISEGTLKACQAYCSPPVSSVCAGGGGTCTCAAPGLFGTPSVATPCPGSCGTCVTTIISMNCAPDPAATIPIGAKPANCI